MRDEQHREVALAAQAQRFVIEPVARDFVDARRTVRPSEQRRLGDGLRAIDAASAYRPIVRAARRLRELAEATSFSASATRDLPASRAMPRQGRAEAHIGAATLAQGISVASWKHE